MIRASRDPAPQMRLRELEFGQMHQKLIVYAPSRLFIYFNERQMENTVVRDAGAQIRDGIKSVASIGVPPEQYWPYDITKFTDKPPQSAYDAAKLDRSLEYRRIDPKDLRQVKDCLAAGYPFVFGFAVYYSIFSRTDGIVPMPTSADAVDGGHAVLAVGYDDEKRFVKFRNSWGPAWGDKGYGYLPYEYFTDGGVGDCWSIRSVVLTADADPISTEEAAA